MSNTSCDVIVVGAGNAALCAALSAQERGAKVLVNHSTDTLVRLRKKGVRFVPRYGSQAFKHEGRFKIFGGIVIGTNGGVSLVDSEIKAAEKQGITIRYSP